MNNEQLDDLKQFIESRISQTEKNLDEKLDGLDNKIDNKISGLEKRLDDLRQEMMDGFAGVGEAIEVIIKLFDDRLSKLEAGT